jgi:pimeloyl-ACP methyl ester carboxylesterase
MSTETTPRIVLVHGAWADGSSWSKVIARLIERDTRVAAVQLPLTSLADDVAATRRVLALEEGPAVLVGHSYGGAVITEVAARSPEVRALVFIAAFAPDAGESLDDLAKQGPPPPGLAFLRPDKSGFFWLDREGFAKVFAADVDPAEARVMAAVQKPLAPACLGDKITEAGWRNRPSWFLISEDDQMIPPLAQHGMAKRIGATARSVRSSHASLVSRPSDVADLIAEAAKGVAR